jgi:hypothetical protein
MSLSLARAHLVDLSLIVTARTHDEWAQTRNEWARDRLELGSGSLELGTGWVELGSFTPIKPAYISESKLLVI